MRKVKVEVNKLEWEESVFSLQGPNLLKFRNSGTTGMKSWEGGKIKLTELLLIDATSGVMQMYGIGNKRTM